MKLTSLTYHHGRLKDFYSFAYLMFSSSMSRFINDMLEESEEQEESTLFRPLYPLERTPEQVVY